MLLAQLSTFTMVLWVKIPTILQNLKVCGKACVLRFKKIFSPLRSKGIPKFLLKLRVASNLERPQPRLLPVGGFLAGWSKLKNGSDSPEALSSSMFVEQLTRLLIDLRIKEWIRINRSSLALSAVLMMHNFNTIALSWCTKISHSRMRVMAAFNAEQRVRWVGVWLTTTATHPRMLWPLNVSVQQFNAHSWELSPRNQRISTLGMANSGNFMLVHPLSVCSIPAVAERSSRTSTGSRCVLNCCMEILPGLHFSNCASCTLPRLSVIDFGRPQAVSALTVLSDHQTMPRLHLRMRCK